MIIKTERLILRRWTDSDAEALYEYAKDPRVGPPAGWQVHTSVNNSLDIIHNVLAVDETYAVVLKNEISPIGSVGICIGDFANLKIPDNEGEIGYWLGVPYWGKGLIPEAVKALMSHAFEELNLDCLWCGYFDGNNKSKRVMEKCGFKFHHTETNKYCSLINEYKTEHITRITKAEWLLCNK